MALRLTLGTRLGALAVISAAVAAVVSIPPAHAAPTEKPTEIPDVTVSITHLSPATLPAAGNLTISGGVRSGNSHPWRNVTIRLVVPRSPFVDHSQARAAITGGNDYTGPLVDGANAIETLGTLPARSSDRYSITIRRSQLPVSGADGVYPIGIQVFADNADGSDGRTIIGRATTFLPAREAASTPTRTVVLWPFLLPGHRTSNGNYGDEAGLLESIGPHGQLRNLLHLARTTPKLGSDALLDPSLIGVLADLAERPATTDAARASRRVAGKFLSDLVSFAKDYSCAAVGYERPDWLAVTRSTEAKDLIATINRATRSTLLAQGLDCTRLEWPSPRSTSRTLLNNLQAVDAAAISVSTRAVPNWQSTTGDLLAVQTPTGSLPLIVNDPLDAGLPGRSTVVGLRQTILSEAVFGSLATDSTKEQRPAILIVDPEFDPGNVAGTPLQAALGTEVIARKNLRATLRSPGSGYVGAIPADPGVVPVSPSQIVTASDAMRTDAVLNSMLVNAADRIEHLQLVTALVSQSWREHRVAGRNAATAASQLLSRELASISVEGPRALTLSSRSGRFPVTIGNNTPHTLRVGISIVSSASGVTFKAPTKVRAAAGESRTITVDMNMDGQTATTVNVRLTAVDGSSFGASTVFNVRSSRVGAALWIAIGISVAFVAIALVRRFGRPGHEPVRPALPPTDFDD
jgi:hypothetical protein